MAMAQAAILEVAAIGSDGNAASDFNSGTFDPLTNQANYLNTFQADANTGNTAMPVISTVGGGVNFVSGDVNHYLFSIGSSAAGWTLPTSTFMDGAGTGVTPVTPGGIFSKITSVASNKATIDAAVGHCELYKPGNIYGLNTTAGVSVEATPTSGRCVVDYTRCGTPIAIMTDLATTTGLNANPTVTSATRNFDARDIGNVLYIRTTGGSGNWLISVFRITTASGGVATLDRACTSTTGTGTGGVAREGGALLSPGMAGQQMNIGNHIYVRKGLYQMAAVANQSGGSLSLPATNAVANATIIYGYNLYRGDAPLGANRPTFQAAAANVTLIAHNAFSAAYYLILDGNNAGTSRGIFGTGSSLACRNYYCSIKNCTNSAILACTSYFCDATGCTTANVMSSGAFYFCVCWNNTMSGSLGAFVAGVNGAVFVNCIAVNTTGGTCDGFQLISFRATCINCLSYGNSRFGFQITAAIAQEISLINCIAANNSSSGINLTAPADTVQLVNCAVYGNTGNNVGPGFTADSIVNLIVCTAAPFNNPGNGDFGLNNTAGGGALLRTKGFPFPFFPGLDNTNWTTGTITYNDVGPIQHQDSGGVAGGVTKLVGVGGGLVS
jgi:hypothetical protein